MKYSVRLTTAALLAFGAVTTGHSQSTPDVSHLLKMSPAELEAYKQQVLKEASSRARQLAAQYNFKIDETLLPDYELHPPVKDLKRLALIPPVVPSVAAVQGSRRKSV